MNRKFAVFFLLLIILAAPLAAANFARLSELEYLFNLIQKEYVQPVAAEKLALGALAGMAVVLKAQNLDAGFLKPARPLTADNAFAAVKTAFEQARENYPRSPELALYQGAVRGALVSLNDPYSVYLSSEDYRQMMEEMQSRPYAGVGIIIEMDNNKQITVVEPVEDSPADKAGVKPGDRILDIDGKSTKGISLDEAQNRIRGPEQTSVKMTLFRPSSNKQIFVTLARKNLTMKAVHSELLAGQIGYLKLRFFGEETGQELKNAISNLKQKGVRSFILDLRNNGGGYIGSAIDTVSLFLPTGSKVTTVVSRTEPSQTYYSQPNFDSRANLVVLVNQFSASASEITGAALQEDQKIKLLGIKTYGKASVQKIFPLPDGSALKLTIAHYFTPKGYDLGHRGIQPDVQILSDQQVLPKALALLQKTPPVPWTQVGDFSEALRKAKSQLPPGYVLDDSRVFQQDGKLWQELTFKSAAGAVKSFRFTEIF